MVLDHGVKLAIAAQLHERIKMSLILEKAIEGNDIGMIQKSLYFEFPDKLFEKILSHNLCLLDNFHRQNKPSLYFLHHENLPEFPLPQL